MPEVRTCSGCLQEKPLNIFPKYGKRCNACRAAYNREWRKNNPVSNRASQKRYKQRHEATYKEAQRVRFMRWRYGITLAAYEEMLNEQNGACAICEKPSHNGKRLVVDHCHATGITRGLLCAFCNQAIGFLGDDVKRILRAAEYVEKYADQAEPLVMARGHG